MTEEIPDSPDIDSAKENPEVTEPPRRRRGRPRKVPVPEGAAPADVGAAATAEKPAGARRGRPKKKQVFDADAREALKRQLIGLHALGALALGIPELQIGETESAMLTDASINVAQEYGLSLTGKTGALIQLVAACAAIYVPRVIAVKRRVAASQATKLHAVQNDADATSH